MKSFKEFVNGSCDLQEGRLHKSAITGLAMRVKAEGTKAEQQFSLAKRLLQKSDKKSEIDLLKISQASDEYIINAMRHLHRQNTLLAGLIAASALMANSN
jgi:hypothetical protein